MNINLAVKKDPLLLAKEEAPAIKPGVGMGFHWKGRRFGKAWVPSCTSLHRGERGHPCAAPAPAGTTSRSDPAEGWGSARVRCSLMPLGKTETTRYTVSHTQRLTFNYFAYCLIAF